MTPPLLSTSQYAKKHHISRNHVIRLIKTGKLPAERIGNNWFVLMNQQPANQIGLEKTTSLQLWNKLIVSQLKKHLAIEVSKDRELIYAKLNGLGLPHERCLAFSIGQFPTKTAFAAAVSRLGLPYWISAVPNPKRSQLNRLTKLGLYSIESGWHYLNRLSDKHEYKIVVSQYPDGADFKGTLLISPQGHGIAEFITGDRHYIMTRGFTLTDPMLFDQNAVVRFSKTVPKRHQIRLHQLVKDIYGHLELQYGKIENVKQITFFDYNDGAAYTEIDNIWNDLKIYFSLKHKSTLTTLFGMPASPGQATGRCVVIHHESASLFNSVKKGDIIVSDTTTPDMTPIMNKAGAIVTDLGGVTSHAAIVCRELKIPAIVGVGNATERLKTGQMVTVNADKGTIDIQK